MTHKGSGYFCSQCGKRLSITKTKYNDDEIYRQRECKKCGEVMYTVEFPVEKNNKFFECWDEASQERAKRI